MISMRWTVGSEQPIVLIKRLVEHIAPSEDGMSKKEVVMSAHGHTTVWGTHLGIGRASDAKRWYQQLRDWWTTHRAARQDVKLATLRARWDARREALKPCRADAAVDLVASTHEGATTTALCALAV